LLLILTNGNYDISDATADRIKQALVSRDPVVEIALDLFDEGNPSMTVLAVRHVVALIDYRRPQAHLLGVASGKVTSLIT
jgi:hypothetical protein